MPRIGETRQIGTVTIHNRRGCSGCRDRLGAWELWVSDVPGTFCSASNEYGIRLCEASTPRARLCASGEYTHASDGDDFTTLCAGLGRYVTLRLPGRSRTLNVAEVQVFASQGKHTRARCRVLAPPSPPLPAPPPPQYPPELGPNVVLHDAPGVGGWTGWCTCPNGERYAVGDQYNGCGSLACIGGSSSDCSWESGRPHAHGARTQVTCASSGEFDSCGLRLQVQETGFVSLVQEDTSDNWLGSPGPGRPSYGRWSDRFAVDSGEVWRVRWEGGSYPTVAGGCSVQGEDNPEYTEEAPAENSRFTYSDKSVAAENWWAVTFEEAARWCDRDSSCKYVIDRVWSGQSHFSAVSRVWRREGRGGAPVWAKPPGRRLPACEPHGSTCVCETSVESSAVFVGTDAPPIDAARELLRIGAPHVAMFDAGTYSSLASGPGGVEAFVRAGSGQLDENAIVAFPVNGTTRHYFNKASTVRIGSSDSTLTPHSFRNPPHFVSFLFKGATRHAAANEIEEVLSHLFLHKNVAPFQCRRLIQRFVTSNPSPTYIRHCAEAFVSGEHDGVTYSGEYGDLGAAVAAVLLDDEARSEILDADPTFGKLREPLMKVLSLLRALEFTPADGRELELDEMQDCIGQQAHQAPSVFNFYKPDSSPPGVARDAAVFAPEGELGTSPLLICLLNGLSSLVMRAGLTSCEQGFGSTNQRRCGSEDSGQDFGRGVDATMGFTPASDDAEAVVDELDLLLTGGRLSPHVRQVILAKYLHRKDGWGEEDAVLHAMQLFTLSLEFHSTNFNALGEPRVKSAYATVGGVRGDYKAVVVLFMNGGLDSYSLLVPHSGCEPHPTHADLHAEYMEVRGVVAFQKTDLLQIDVPDGGPNKTHPCSRMGLNPVSDTVKDLYEDGSLALLANIGSLIDPVADKHEYRSGGLRLPPGLFSHSVRRASLTSPAHLVRHPQPLSSSLAASPRVRLAVPRHKTGRLDREHIPHPHARLLHRANRTSRRRLRTCTRRAWR